MLVLSRKNGESIRVGNDIEITVCQVSGNRVRLAISAPKDVSIRRSELDDRQRSEAASPPTSDLPLAMILSTDFSQIAHTR